MSSANDNVDIEDIVSNQQILETAVTDLVATTAIEPDSL
jgi:hypothetical protein